MRWLHHLSLRGRLVLIGTLGLAVALALGGILLVAVLQLVLLRSVDTGARHTGEDVVQLIEAGDLPDTLPTTGTQFVQVLNDRSQILSASIGADRLVPLLRPEELALAQGGVVVQVGGDRVGINGDLRVAATRAGSGAQARTVLVGVPVRDVQQSVLTVERALLVAYPLLLAGLAVLGWRVVGWTLRPVEALRAGAEEITATRTGRLPVPDGQDEVHRLAVTLNDMLDRLDRARTRQRAFVADAAHELRSPIASLRTQLEVAEHLGEPAPSADLRAEVDRLAGLVDDLLLLARADEGDPALHRREPVELAALLAGTAAGYTGSRVPVLLSPSDPQWTLGDPAGLRRVVDNLLSNAVRYAGTRVTLSLRRAGQRVLVAVADDGPGIPPADRDRVFQRFTRLDGARARDGGGAGLGLAIVNQLVRMHGGSVGLADAGPGLLATVNLPAASPPADQ
ncbi:MAG: HAMP domain-containing protein [Micromonosporaceae bacterium]|nr:HAMP domain-containing protein [Micromonosporaceae bacterium]